MSNGETIRWPNGNNCQFLILPVNNASAITMKDALSFVCGNSFFYDKESKKSIPSSNGIEPSRKILSKAIQLEGLFTEASGRGADEEQSLDYHRYQSPSSRQQSLLKCEAIAKIAASIHTVIEAQITGYSLYRITVLYSLPFGRAQGLHFDDHRNEDAQKKDGEMLSVLFALMDNTKLDICQHGEERKTYSIPAGTMFLFSGKCLHGGSSYSDHNIRLHMFFTRDHLIRVLRKENIVPWVFNCPVPSCVCNTTKKRSFTKSQWYDHWRNTHRAVVGLSLGNYLKEQSGLDIYRCVKCLKGFTTMKGLKRHSRSRCKASVKASDDSSCSS